MAAHLLLGGRATRQVAIVSGSATILSRPIGNTASLGSGWHAAEHRIHLSNGATRRNV